MENSAQSPLSPWEMARVRAAEGDASPSPPAPLSKGEGRPSLPVWDKAPTVSPQPGDGCDRFLLLLREFYKSLAEPPAIDATFVSAESLPQPQRALLAHASDMTSTLARYHGEPIGLKVLQRHQGPHWYRRHIVLETTASRRLVEYGAMRVSLPLLSEAARLDVLAAKMPLGAVLARHGLAYRHCPGGFFTIHSNRLIEQALGLSWPQWLFGRCNCMSDSVGRVVAEVIEILPP
jgi:hypothetical protein